MSYEQDNEKFLKVLSYYLNFEENIVDSQKVEEVEKFGVTKERAFALVLAESLGIDTFDKDRAFFENYFIPSIKWLKTEDYYNDEYFKLIPFSQKALGTFEMKYMSAKPYQGFVRDDFKCLFDGRVIPQIGFFDTEYRYPAVLQDGREWMTLLPNEINSQIKYIEEAFGNVLTYGLGLGYYVLKVALKDNVESVTVVDIDKNVISLFKENVLPYFPKTARDKVKIVNSDAFKFAESENVKAFDYIYADIWHDVGDGVELYKKFKIREKFADNAKFGYWIEDTIKFYL